MSSNGQRFAVVVLHAFEARHLNTDDLVKAAGGPSNSYMTGLRKASHGHIELTEPRSDTYRRIEAAANWREGSARAVWHGNEPQLRDASEQFTWNDLGQLGPRLNGYDRQIDALWREVEELKARLSRDEDDLNVTQLRNAPDADRETEGQGHKAARTAKKPSGSKRSLRQADHQDAAAEAPDPEGPEHGA